MWLFLRFTLKSPVSQPGEIDYIHHITNGSLGFSNHPTALSVHTTKLPLALSYYPLNSNHVACNSKEYVNLDDSCLAAACHDIKILTQARI